MILSTGLFVALVALTLLAGLGVAGLELAVRRRRRRVGHTGHRLRLLLLRSLAVVLTVALALTTVADGFNRHYQYIPSWGALFGDISPDLVHGPVPGDVGGPALPAGAKAPEHGLVEEREVPGPVSGIEARTTYVYLPAAYFDPAQENRRFPVVYLIHGSPGISADWLRGGHVDLTMDELLHKGTIEPFIVVMPDVNGGYSHDVECQDVVGGPQAQTYLTRDITAWTDTTYRTLADRDHRAIGGLSTGGYCGINLLFRHPDVFSAAVSHSGYGHPDHNAYTGDLFGHDRALADANTPDRYLATIPIQMRTGVYLDAGSDDRESRHGSQKLYDLLQSRQVSTTLQIVSGEGHTFDAFRRNLLLSLPWLSAWFAGAPAATGQQHLDAPDDSYLPPIPPTAPPATVARTTTSTRSRSTSSRAGALCSPTPTSCHR